MYLWGWSFGLSPIIRVEGSIANKVTQRFHNRCKKKTSNLSQTRWLWTATDHLTLDGWRESLADDPPIVHNSFSRVFAVSVLVVSAHFYRANLVCIYANQRAIRENNPNSLDATIRQWSFDNRAGKMLLHLWTLFGVIVCVLVRENSAALKGDNTFWRRGGSRSVLAKATRSTRIELFPVLLWLKWFVGKRSLAPIYWQWWWWQSIYGILRTVDSLRKCRDY